MSETAAVTGRPSYRELLAEPGVRRMLSWSVLGRLPLSMFPLGLILLARSSGAGYGAAAVPGAGYAIALALGTPIAGRSVDRLGIKRALLPRALGLGVATAGALACALASGPIVVLAACAVVMGATTPPVTAATRAAWRKRLSSPSMLGIALNLDASAHECVYVCGPALVALLAAADPSLALVAAAAFGVIGTAGFTATAPRGSGHRTVGRAGAERALRSAGMRVLFVAALPLGAAVGLIETSMPAFAERHGHRALAGVAIAFFAIGSAIGAVALSRQAHRSAQRRLRLAALALPAATAVPLLAGSIPAMCGAVALAGLPMSSVLASAYVLVASLAPASSQTEAFAWISTALYAGGAAGTALAGQLIVSGGPSRSLLAGLVAGIGCSAVALFGLRYLGANRSAIA